MKKIILSISLLFIVLHVNAQTPEFRWATEFDNTIIWTVGGVNSCSAISQGLSIAYDSAKNIYTTGFFDMETDFKTSNYNLMLPSVKQISRDAYVSKQDQYGNTLWARRMGGTGSDSGVSITVDDLGNSYVIGRYSFKNDFGSLLLPDSGWFACKIDTNGNFLWVKKIDNLRHGYINFISLALNQFGNIYILGTLKGVLEPVSGITVSSSIDSIGDYLDNSVIINLDSASGTYNNVKINNFGTNTENSGNAICVDNIGSIIITGNYIDSLFNEKSFISKRDVTGSQQWLRFNDNSKTTSVVTDAARNIYVGGSFNSNASAVFTGNKSSIVLTTPSGKDGFILKMNYLGMPIWAKKIGADPNSTISIKSIDVDKHQRVFATGIFRGSLFGNTNFLNNDKMFISMFNTTGNLYWGKSIVETNGYINSNSIKVDSDLNIYTTGGFGANRDISANTIPTDFNPDLGTLDFRVIMPSSQDIFVHKMNIPATIITNSNTPNSNKTTSTSTEFNSLNNSTIKIYPNPNNGNFFIKTNNSSEPIEEVKIYNIQGKLLFTKKLTSISEEIKTTELSKGIYILNVEYENGSSSNHKIIMD